MKLRRIYFRNIVMKFLFFCVNKYKKFTPIKKYFVKSTL